MMIKPGIRTTEFWGTVAFDVGMIATAATSVLPAKWAALAASIATAAYTISRGLTKNGNGVVGQ